MPQKIEAYTYKKYLNIDDDYIINYFFTKSKKRIYKRKLINIPKEINNYLIKRYNDSSSIEETIYRIKNNIKEHPICPICNKPVKYVGGTRFFLKTCGDEKCTLETNLLHKKETMIFRYGVDNPSKSEEIRNKIIQTNIKKYGTKSPLQNNKIKEKTKKTNLEKYGVEIPQLNKEIKKKIYESLVKTNLEKYGVDNYSKLKNTSNSSKQ